MPLAFLEFALHWSWAAAWFWLLLLVGLVWSRRHLDLNRADRNPILSPQDAGNDLADLPPLTVLVAAKDEEVNIGRCLEGLLAQDYPQLQVVVANDRSSDRTAEIIEQFAVRDPRLTTVHVDALPDGWTGKNHAMHCAQQRATGTYFCFTDADCRFHSPRLLAAAVRYAQREKTDLLSVLPELEAFTFWERVVQPPAGAILVFWFPPEKVNSRTSPRAYANGAFMLLPRAAYDRLGGHEGLRGIIAEDMTFARRTKQAGLSLQVIRGGGMYSVRMYAGLSQIWNGWTRIFHCCFGTLPRLLVSVIFLSVFSVFPLLSLLLAPLAGSAAAGIAIAAVVAVILQQTVLWRFYLLSRTKPAWALTYPLGAAVCLAITLNAITRHFGVATNWRGTVYRRPG